MSDQQPNNPLHGLTLETILTQLVERYQWDGLHARIRVNCFENDPSIKSSLKFLRKTQWARDKVEALYIKTFVDEDESERLVLPQPKRTGAKPYAKKRNELNKQHGASGKHHSTSGKMHNAPNKAHSTPSKTHKTPPANVWTMNKPKSD